MSWKKKEDYANSVSHARMIRHLPVSIGVIGAGDVGRNLLLGLRLLGKGTIENLSFWEMNPNQAQRILHEVGVIRAFDDPLVPLSYEEDLSGCDVIVFAASGGVPPLGDEKKVDVRLLQYEANARILGEWIDKLESTGFTGLYFILSDPVDFLCQTAVECFSLPSQRVIGFGQGVMYARAAFYGGAQVHIYGPHGAGLWVANDPFNYDPLLSQELTQKTVVENVLIRGLGFKPFIAPAFTSGALSMLSYLRSESHYASHYIQDIYWGELFHPNKDTWHMEPLADERLFSDVLKTYERCRRDVRKLLD